MPYVALPENGRESRLADADARWDRIRQRQPELEQTVKLQRELIRVTIDTAEVIGRGRLPRLSLPPRYVAAKLLRGVPAIAREPIPVPVSALQPALSELCQELVRGGAGDAPNQIRSAIAEGLIDAASLLTASLSRNQQAIRACAIHQGWAPDLLWLVAELAVSPYANHLQRVLLGSDTSPELTAALDAWPHGYCPACGSWPAMAEVVSGRRLLRCSFCALAWDLTASGCVQCGEKVNVAVDEADEGSRGRALELCDACRTYLKSLDVARPSPFPLVAVSDLDTMDLDVAAMERGYGRPALKGFALRG